ncbi:MAG: response regulator [Bacteroidales bacterium]|nr:response regulator [Bacteroidales bacterium]
MTVRYSYIVVDENISMKTIIPHKIKAYDNFLFSAYFSSVQDAWNYLKCNPCDLMFLSLEMSDMDGFEFLELLESHPHPPLTILLSTDEVKHSTKAHLYYCKRMIDFMGKNFDNQRIAVSLERFLKVANTALFLPKMIKEPIGQILTIGTQSNSGSYPISQITHFIHERNYTYFYVYNQKRQVQYVALKQVEALLPAGCSVKISRNSIVMLDYIVQWNEENIVIRTAGNTTKSLKISSRRKEQVLKLLRNMMLRKQ